MTELRTNEPGGDVRLLVEQIARSLVDEPDQVSVAQVEEGAETVLELTVAPNDMGKVIGRQGRTARALRSLVNAAGVRFQKRFALEILE
jgi:predicted RNA-binding protein YlqC (UPF0109 family)